MKGMSILCLHAANMYTLWPGRSYRIVFRDLPLTMGLLCSVDEEEIDLQTSALRQKLSSSSPSDSKSDRKGQFKPHQVHELAKAKIEESEKLRKALGISANYEEGSHWKKQEERLRDGLGEKELER